MVEMKKTLIVSYTPREEKSATKQLQDCFAGLAEGKAHVEVLDIAQAPPRAFDKKSIAAYYKRNYGGEKLGPAEAKHVEEFDLLTAQFKSADFVVFAYPMYNFSLPAAVKAYFDAVMLKGETWDMDAKGFTGLLKGKRGLVITTSGGAYGKEFGNDAWDHSAALSKVLLEFMGFEVDIVAAQGLIMMVGKKDEILDGAKEKLRAVAQKWYG
ncbi:hypothetical protein FJZ26_01340 [Candidatus Parvarchaeota archaeon]|nr:hypothetical protein [Candidatus Parvarchaeota archaeon]